MTDYISRNLLLQNARDNQLANAKAENRFDYAIWGKICEWVENAPAADVVERKHGSWWKSEDELGESWMCSECLYEFFSEDPDFTEYVNYCPNCGVRMVNE